MSYMFDFAIIGGDNRQVFLADLLCQKDFSVCYYGLSLEALPLNFVKNFSNHTITNCPSLQYAIENSKYIIGPIPFSKDNTNVTTHSIYQINVTTLYSMIKPDQLLFAGAFSKSNISLADENTVSIIDMMKCEEVAIMNSVATAEGAICEAIQKSNINLQEANSLILGFGRCGQILAKKVKALDSNLYVSVRKKEVLSSALAYGYQGFLLDELEYYIEGFDFIFNTIPSIILTKELLCKTKEEVTIIDIASSPGGVDYNFAKAHSYNAHLCLALPGKLSPKSSAQILLDNILCYCK